ncbi:hypothetical protein [Arthrobacter sp. NA-172]|uniref:hypothetical protein n=1 Tax=Arthrobacter sp. NA-172 TaxID=3367524 RepID=UPI0037543445
MTMFDAIRATLEEHRDWACMGRSLEIVYCTGAGCEWSVNERQWRASDLHREHVAAVVAGIMEGELADAWDEGRDHGAVYPFGKRGLATDDNPYRR